MTFIRTCLLLLLLAPALAGAQFLGDIYYSDLTGQWYFGARQQPCRLEHGIKFRTRERVEEILAEKIRSEYCIVLTVLALPDGGQQCTAQFCGRKK